MATAVCIFLKAWTDEHIYRYTNHNIDSNRHEEQAKLVSHEVVRGGVPAPPARDQ